MNKHTFSQIKLGDVFRHLETGAIYRLIKVNTPVSMNFGQTYEFTDLTIDQPWTLSKKQFMKYLKPAPEVAKILYADK